MLLSTSQGYDERRRRGEVQVVRSAKAGIALQSTHPKPPLVLLHIGTVLHDRRGFLQLDLRY